MSLRILKDFVKEDNDDENDVQKLDPSYKEKYTNKLSTVFKLYEVYRDWKV